MLDKHQLAKREFVINFFEEYRHRWKNIKSLQKYYPSEGMVLAYCFIEAIGYYRYGFGETKLSSLEQFIKILYKYQNNKHLVIPPLIISRLPLEKKNRTLGRDIKRILLLWLKENHSQAIGLRIDLLWQSVPKEIKRKLSDSEQKIIGHLYQVCWGGLYYDLIRTAGVHKAHFPKRDETDWSVIESAGDSVLENLRKECIKNVKFPHQLTQADTIFD